MALSNELISQFVKATNDENNSKKESTMYGKIIKQGDVEYVQLDGSELLTPISSTTVVKDGDRVMVTIKNHTAIVTGDFTNPSASNKDVVEIGNKISEFEIIIADKVSTEQLEAEIARIEKLRTDELEATNAKIETLEGKVAKIDTIEADVIEVSGKVTAHEGEFDTLRADIADFKNVTTESVKAVEGKFNTLEADYTEFEETTINKLNAQDATIGELEADMLTAEKADLKYANIDFSNINEASIEKLFTDSGMIGDLVMKDGKVTGKLVGVTIIGDLIEGNTVKADKLVVLGEDGLYYKLNVNSLGEAVASSDPKYQNGLDGSNIIAQSITAEHIAVTDLVAFGATIGGFHIGNHSLYSGVKESINNNTEGVYLGDDGQVNVGDTHRYLKYFIDENGDYKLEIAADSILFGVEKKSIEEVIRDNTPDLIKEAEGTELTIKDGIKVIDFNIYGKSEQIVSTQNENLCPPPNSGKWVLENGAYIDANGNIQLPNLTSVALVVFEWNGRSNTATFRYTITSGGNGYVIVSYHDKDMNKINSNGNAIDGKADGYEHKVNFGGDNVYGEALSQAVYIRVLFQRGDVYGANPYSVNNIFLSDQNVEYVPFIPNTPSPEYPSEIKSLGHINIFDSEDWYKTLNTISAVSMRKEVINEIEYYRFKPDAIYSHEYMKGQFKENTQYTIVAKARNYDIDTRQSTGFSFVYTDGTSEGFYINATLNEYDYVITSEAGKTINYIRLGYAYNDYVLMRDIAMFEGVVKHKYVPFNKYGIDVEVTGENILPKYSNTGSVLTSGEVTLTQNEDGTFTLNGTATKYGWVEFIYDFKYGTAEQTTVIDKLDQNSEYILSFHKISGTYTGTSPSITVQITSSNVTVTSQMDSSTLIKNGDGIYRGCITVYPNTTFDNLVVGAQLKKGNVLTEFEPSRKDISTIVLNEPLQSISNDIRDTYENGVITRRISKVILNGSETWYDSYFTSNGYFHTSIPGKKGGLDNFKCDTFKNARKVVVDSNTIIGNSTKASLSICPDNNIATSLEEWKTWLSNNNVEVIYELTTPIIEEVDPVFIPMYEDRTNIYRIEDDVTPDMYCKYYTKYAKAIKELDDDLDNTDKILSDLSDEYQVTKSQVSELEILSSGINATVSEVKVKQDATDKAVEALDKDISELTNTVSAKMSATDVQIAIQTELANGVSHVKTSTGFTFDQNGLTVSKTGKEMTTNIDEDGMTIKKNDEERLVANNEGVIAYDLQAKTYLIVGENSRFEDYEKDGKPQTGCFWIGDTEV